MSISREKLLETVQDAATNGRLSCEQAHELGRRLGVPLRDIGEACNELKIKIATCQLGCF